MNKQNIVILGAPGNIGSQFADDLCESIQSPHYTGQRRIVGMSHSRGYIFNPNGIYETISRPAQIKDLNTRDSVLATQGRTRQLFKNWMNQHPYYFVGDLQNLSKNVEEEGLKDNIIYVDLTAADITKFHQEIISHTHSNIVTANKITVAESPYETFQMLTKDRSRYAYSCSVMAGAEAVRFLRDCLDVGDKVTSIEACASGTCNKLASSLEKGDRPFSQIVLDLHKAGDTEPDVRDDLDGGDTAKKIVILPRSAGYNLELKEVIVDPFIPGGFGHLAGCSKEEFLENLQYFDEKMESLFSLARAKGKTLRYVASFYLEKGRPKARVELREVPLDSPFGSLKGSANKVVIHTGVYNPIPYIIEAPGAGRIVTANNVLRDLNRVA